MDGRRPHDPTGYEPEEQALSPPSQSYTSPYPPLQHSSAPVPHFHNQDQHAQPVAYRTVGHLGDSQVQVENVFFPGMNAEQPNISPQYLNFGSALANPGEMGGQHRIPIDPGAHGGMHSHEHHPTATPHATQANYSLSGPMRGVATFQPTSVPNAMTHRNQNPPNNPNWKCEEEGCKSLVFWSEAFWLQHMKVHRLITLAEECTTRQEFFDHSGWSRSSVNLQCEFCGHDFKLGTHKEWEPTANRPKSGFRHAIVEHLKGLHLKRADLGPSLFTTPPTKGEEEQARRQRGVQNSLSSHYHHVRGRTGVQQRLDRLDGLLEPPRRALW